MVEEVIGKKLGRPKGVIQYGSPHWLANELRRSPKEIRRVLRMLTPEHLHCHRGNNGSPAPTYGKLKAYQVAMVTAYVLGTDKERKNLRENVPRVGPEISPPPDSPLLF